MVTAIKLDVCPVTGVWGSWWWCLLCICVSVARRGGFRPPRQCQVKLARSPLTEKNQSAPSPSHRIPGGSQNRVRHSFQKRRRTSPTAETPDRAGTKLARRGSPDLTASDSTSPRARSAPAPTPPAAASTGWNAASGIGSSPRSLRAVAHLQPHELQPAKTHQVPSIAPAACGPVATWDLGEHASDPSAGVYSVRRWVRQPAVQQVAENLERAGTFAFVFVLSPRMHDCEDAEIGHICAS